MANFYNIVIDTIGSDKGPETIILGASLLLNKHHDVKVTLVGDEELIKLKIIELNMDSSRVSIIDAKETITNYDNIMEAFFKKKDASLIKAIKEVANNDETIGMITAGNSGAVLVGSLTYLKTPELTRPCMAAVLPTFNNSFVLLVDTGATVDCTVSQLHEFAKLGSNFMKRLYKLDAPRIGLLSNGAEETKGNKLVKETHKILKEDNTINFIGNIEANIALNGVCDVIVADGFAGNMLLKTCECVISGMIGDIVKYSKVNNAPEIMPLVKHLVSGFNITESGGAIVLGIKKPIIKCRGNSGENAIVATGEILINVRNGETFFEGKTR